MNKALFLDRDGTINIDTGHLYRIEDFKFIDGVQDLIKKYNDKNYKVIVITNQSGIARKYYTEEDVHRLHAYINEELKKIGAHIDAFYFCPHHPDFIGECDCRKPKPKMILQAAKDLNIDLKKSILIGDKEIDIQAGINAGIRRIVLLKNLYAIDGENTKANEIVNDLWELKI